ncbi:MAG: polysaccharide biosynthesis protein [Planctomycetes bacterium]|nr:polysaccharide biosynthesis protein [Planctomycetota bacterium]
MPHPHHAGFTSWRLWILGFAHLMLFALIYLLAFMLRFEFAIPPNNVDMLLNSLVWVLPTKLLIFYLGGHYHGWWRYVTFSDLRALLRASVLSLLALAFIDHFAIDAYQIPRSILILDMLVTVMIIGSLRASWRLANEQYRAMFGGADRQATFVVGTDDSTALLAHQINSHSESQYQIRGFLETNGAPTSGRRLGQIPVMGRVADVVGLSAKHGVEQILVVSGTLPGDGLRKLMKTCENAGLELKIVPRVEDLFRGDNNVPIRDIEIADLLHREPVQLDCAAIAHMLAGRTVMVTGAGGSIGSEICRQVLKFKPARLMLVGRGENRIFEIQRQLADQHVDTDVRPFIADVGDEPRMRTLFEQFRPDVIFHAAAHKHVPLMEQNVGEAIKNNVFGTKCLADLADEFEAKSFVMVSTDKAVHPTSVMGASKHLAENYVHSMSLESKTRFVVTRFGNVLGSAGSVVPIFQDQIRRGGPITVTHPDMTRFFMTIPEASQLVLQAGSMGRGGEIFVLEMGEAVKIVDLAEDLIALSGPPEGSIDIVFTSTRPGEKLYEKLYFEHEEMMETSHPKLQIAYHRSISRAEVESAILSLRPLCDGPEHLIRQKVHDLIPEFLSRDSRTGTPARPLLTPPPAGETA